MVENLHSIPRGVSFLGEEELFFERFERVPECVQIQLKKSMCHLWSKVLLGGRGS